MVWLSEDGAHIYTSDGQVNLVDAKIDCKTHIYTHTHISRLTVGQTTQNNCLYFVAVARVLLFLRFARVVESLGMYDCESPSPRPA